MATDMASSSDLSVRNGLKHRSSQEGPGSNPGFGTINTLHPDTSQRKDGYGKRLPLPERFWEKVDKSGGPDACWPWLGRRNDEGYGTVKVDGNTRLAHRVAWRLANRPDAAGVVLRHSCDNPPCCNPAHLSLGSHADNIADKVARGRQARGEANGRAVLTREDAEAIRVASDFGQTRSSLARLYGVDRKTIRNIATDKSWR